MRLLEIAPDTTLSILRDPFSCEHVKRIVFWIRRDLRDVTWIFEADVTFMNGSTKGEQSLKAETFPELIAVVDKFLQSLK